MGTIRVLVVDDSAFMRRIIGDVIRADGDLELAGTARNGEEALEKIRELSPDLVTLDVEMPCMDGLDALKSIMKERPIPVLMVSSLTFKGSETTVEALAAGAVDFIPKPSLARGETVEDLRRALPVKIKTAARARLDRWGPADHFPPRKLSPTGPAKPPRTARRVVAVAASTGGPRALDEVMSRLPGDLPAAVLITQHMPPGFTASLARRLNRTSPLWIKEAEDGDCVREGTAFIAPGDYHLLVKEGGRVALDRSPPVQHVRPAADVMMYAAAESFGRNCIGVVLTGMGRDGAEGMAFIKRRGGRTVVQDPEEALIDSMPRAVIMAGHADAVVPLSAIAAKISELMARDRV